ncbi:MAG TPA: 16S rRNA (adenine(1518)-N(6)/adenine(1519)-N(6))-dimethyltransferase RsmA [Anaerolineaceae bacterium]
MDPALELPPLNIPALLREHGLSPQKSLGQNFLTDPAALRKIVEAAELNPKDEVLEVGTGLGSLTRLLALACERVVTVELDRKLQPVIHQVLGGYANIIHIQGDMLLLNPAEIMKKDGYRVVANIPYYITSALIRHLLEAEYQPSRLVLTIQKEVAQRICAEPGDLSLLALSVQVYGQPRIAAYISAGAFYPPPKVDSAVLQVELFPQPRLPVEHMDAFFRLAKAGFSQKRKALRNSLAGGLGCKPVQVEAILERAGIDPMRRAETLSIPEWGQVIASSKESA